MKTFARLIRRYVLAAVGVVLCCCFPALPCWGGWAGGRAAVCRSRNTPPAKLQMLCWKRQTGWRWGQRTRPQEWMDGYAWAMVLDDAGAVRWS